MRISITGANGFLGKKIIDVLRRDGHHVIAWVREPPISGYHIDCRSFDLNRPEDINLSDSDVLIHCAAYVPSNFEDTSEAEKCLTLNGLATLKLLRAAERDALKKFVHISTGQIYSWKSPTSEATEDDKLDQIERATPYLVSKWVGDTYVRSHKGNTNTVVLRPSYIYGPGMKSHGLLPRIVNAIKNSEYITMSVIGNYNVDLVYVEDVAKMTSFSATSAISGVYNVGGGKAISTRELTQTMADVIGKPIVISDAPTELDRCHPSLNIDKIKDLGYRPINLADGLGRYWKSING